jgi:hypothetical protein
MIMTKEERLLKAQGQLLGIIRLIEQAVENGRRIDEAERDVFTKLMEIGKTMLEEFVASQGDGDVGERVERNGRSLRRLRDLHNRRYLSIFGELAISRCVYAVREGQKVEYAPVDQQLGLPAVEFSYVLEDWQQRLCVQESYGDACKRRQTLCGTCSTIHLPLSAEGQSSPYALSVLAKRSVISHIRR